MKRTINEGFEDLKRRGREQRPAFHPEDGIFSNPKYVARGYLYAAAWTQLKKRPRVLNGQCPGGMWFMQPLYIHRTGIKRDTYLGELYMGRCPQCGPRHRRGVQWRGRELVRDAPQETVLETGDEGLARAQVCRHATRLAAGLVVTMRGCISTFTSLPGRHMRKHTVFRQISTPAVMRNISSGGQNDIA